MGNEVPEHEYVLSCPAGGCDARFIGMTPDEYREEHAQEGVCAKGKLSQLFAFPTVEYRHERKMENQQ